jgi:hypothetical protein
VNIVRTLRRSRLCQTSGKNFTGGRVWTSTAARAVAYAEDVARIDRPLRGADQLEAGMGMDLRQEGLPNLADAVVV